MVRYMNVHWRVSSMQMLRLLLPVPRQDVIHRRRWLLMTEGINIHRYATLPTTPLTVIRPRSRPSTFPDLVVLLKPCPRQLHFGLNPYPDSITEQRDRRLATSFTNPVVPETIGRCAAPLETISYTPTSAAVPIQPTRCGAGLAGREPRHAKMPQRRLYWSYGRRSTCYRSEKDILKPRWPSKTR